MTAVPTANRKQRRVQESTQRTGNPTVLTEFVQAAHAVKAGDLARAQTICESIVAKHPDHADAWNVLGVVAARGGNPQEALDVYERAIVHAPNGAELHRNYATLLRQLNRPDEAEIHLKRALELKPDYETAAWGLSVLYLQQNRQQDAERALRAGMKTHPDKAKYPMQLVQLLEFMKRHAEMEPLLVAAIQAARVSKDDETLTKALALLGGILYHRGERIKALPFLHEAVTRGADTSARSVFCHCISKIRFGAANPELKPLLTRAFREVWIRPAEIMRVSSNLLFHETAFKEAALLLHQPDSMAGWLEKDCTKTIALDPLLLALMAATMVTDAALEQLLTRCRRALLEARLAGADVMPFAPLIMALAHQGFANEYAFIAVAEEEVLVTRLEISIAAALDVSTPVAATDIALLAAYRPLHDMPFADILVAHDWPAELAPIITRQIREPLAERALCRSIECITPITDAVSEAVRNQYEENPYPRWMEAPGKEGTFTPQSWVRTYFPEAPAITGDYADPIAILVAGCGTGQQSVNSALRFERSHVLAVDLSLASLAYAIRKTKEFGIDNVTYAQGDLLELDALGRTFDMVECGGVLHHLASPLQGWQVLADITRAGGLMTIALYSELARRYLEPVRAYAKEQNFGTSTEELRRFRASIFALPADHPVAQVAQRRDFYSLSMLRDLVFHVQEHRYTIGQIADELKILGLVFGGFNVAPESKQKFLAHFGDKADLLSLDQWAAFEEAVPETFLGMYQFLAVKAA